MEKYGKFWKNGRFSGRIWPDWGNTTRADMAGLGSIGDQIKAKCLSYRMVTVIVLLVKEFKIYVLKRTKLTFISIIFFNVDSSFNI